MKTISCSVCDCTGNESCGHKPYDKDWLCALRPDGVCGCCRVKKGAIDPELKAEIDEKQRLIDYVWRFHPHRTERIGELYAEKAELVERIRI